MSLNRNPAAEFRDAAMRMVAASEYFKVAGELPLWAREQLGSWDDSSAAVTRQRAPSLSASR